ncbi:hypothetical protein ACP6C7_07190 [Mycolicibacterium septicum]|uniref:Uncharacterized protein n=1 Tax=Mycolicibacterium septicum TaxID=98668 RepID=A0ABW9LQP3_9MYCO
MGLLDDYPERFGWRIWNLNTEPARLHSPFHDGELATRFLDTQCPHGNQPPSPACVCGIHYTPDLQQFIIWQHWNNPSHWLGERTAITYGIGAGHVLPDQHHTDPGAMRARRYYALAIHISADLAHHADELRTHYRLAVTPTLNTDALTATTSAVADALSTNGPKLFDLIARATQ